MPNRPDFQVEATGTILAASKESGEEAQICQEEPKGFQWKKKDPGTLKVAGH